MQKKLSKKIPYPLPRDRQKTKMISFSYDVYEHVYSKAELPS